MGDANNIRYAHNDDSNCVDFDVNGCGAFDVFSITRKKDLSIGPFIKDTHAEKRLEGVSSCQRSNLT